MTCPRCRRPIDGYPALSRLDNRTAICSPCGTAEALFDYFHPGEPLPPLDREVQQ